MRLDDYLRRIAVSGPLAATADTLRRIHRAHREAFLFENLTIQTGGRIALRGDTLVRSRDRRTIQERVDAARLPEVVPRSSGSSCLPVPSSATPTTQCRVHRSGFIT